MDKLQGVVNKLSLARQVYTAFSALEHLWVNVYPGYASGCMWAQQGGGMFEVIAVYSYHKIFNRRRTNVCDE